MMDDMGDGDGECSRLLQHSRNNDNSGSIPNCCSDWYVCIMLVPVYASNSTMQSVCM